MKNVDPYELESYIVKYDWKLFQFKVSIERFSFTGASNIVIRNLHNNVLFGTFGFDLLVPELNANLANSAIAVTVGDNSVESELKGSISIKNIRLVGQVHYRGSIIIGVEIVGISLQNSIDAIEADLSIVRNGIDISEPINVFLNDTLPNTLANFRSEINAILAEIIMAIIRRLTY
ncbi:uncharacterized protein LOC123663515 [Melitaea cinxia]|uniref:uncharacterized protein LOC123663515 n=1 Tax=Melitaea cinxia TaxID=113334 RepID=UPI001E270A2E|nr:uncharacterized protein LOC123663515 [Melitaea cinxia]